MSTPAVDAAVDSTADADAATRFGIQRPQRADARRNYDALLEAARAAFAADGTEASLEDIARRAGVGIGTLYRNFPARSDLIEAVYVGEIEALLRVGAESTALAPLEAFESWIGQFVEYMGTKRALIDGINKDGALFQACRGAMYESGGPVLERAQAAGVIRSDTDILDVTRMLAGIAGVVYDDPLQRDRVLGFAIDGLRTR